MSDPSGLILPLFGTGWCQIDTRINILSGVWDSVGPEKSMVYDQHPPRLLF